MMDNIFPTSNKMENDAAAINKSCNSSQSAKHSSPKRSKRKSDLYFPSSEPEHVKNLVISMLKGKRFIGKFQQTRYVDALQEYREVIEVDEHEPIIGIATDLRKRLQKAFPHCWIGFTSSKSTSAPYVDGNCFWTAIHDRIFDLRYIRIQDIEFRDNEVFFKLDFEERLTQSAPISDFDVEKVLSNVKKFSHDFTLAVWKHLTMQNVKSSLTFITALFITVLTGFVYLGDWSLRLMREITHMVHAFTPIAIKVLDIVQKIIGACFILIASMWRDLCGSGRRPNSRRNHRRDDNYLRNNEQRWITC